ncbi:MAG: cell division transport system permease protein [Thermoanaerobacteraceae bacterium]|jgi:cell division transport system permease protein|nr:cell division transport system permease protein [Thermoanaerobacteraceae bacterium]MDN5301721.1 cell division transport system permease protein [Thermoanaerobacteraceae bacterium]MDN5311552.1 cell division transport system permease protein [Thermoanaerobacteraceae bacterium]RKL64093.1 ABC transporter permease [Thermoanaerobacteraceae bacterium SP2]
MRLRTFNYFFREAFISLIRNRWMSLASIGAVASALIILGSFLLISVNFDHILKDVESQVEITAYLEDTVDSSGITRLNAEISSVSGVKEIKFVSREAALEEFKQQVGKDLLEGIDNPLPNSFRIKVDNPQDVARVAGEIQHLQGVEEVKYGKGVVEKLFNIIYWVRLLGLVIMAIFAAVSIFIISNTIRLTVFARRREINIMKYIGATDWFVRWPFLIEGMVLGFIGAAIAIGILAGGYNYLYNIVRLNIPMISLIPMEEFYNYALGFLAIGMFIGAFGSSFSIRRFLHV